MSEPNVSTLNKGSITTDIVVSGYSHDVGRFGMISKLVLHNQTDDDLIDYYSIDNDVPDDILVTLMSCVGQSITLVSNVVKDGTLTYIPVVSTLPPVLVTPECYSCHSTVVEHLGSLYCSSHECPERLESRVVYYVSRSGTPIDMEQLVDVSRYIHANALGALAFVDIIAPQTYAQGTDLGLFHGRTLMYLEEYLKVLARSLSQLDRDTKACQDMSRFLMLLSIPNLTSDVIHTIIQELRCSEESVFLLSRIGAYLNDINPNYYTRYIRELGELEGRLFQYVYN